MRADAVIMDSHIPGVGLELADAEGDFLVIFLDTEDDGLDFLADFEDFAWFRNAFCPGKFGDVDEPFDALFEFDKGTVGDEVDDFSFDV